MHIVVTYLIINRLGRNMSRERIVYPTHPETLTVEHFYKMYPLVNHDLKIEQSNIHEKINRIKLMIYGLVGSTPSKLVNENDDPLEYMTDKLLSLLKDYKYLITELWWISHIEEYEACFNDLLEDIKNNKINEDTCKPVKPYVWFSGVYVESTYACDSEIESDNHIIDSLINELMMFVCADPSSCFNKDDKYVEGNSWDEVNSRINIILDDEEGIEYYWWHILNYEFIRDNFNEDSYNSY